MNSAHPAFRRALRAGAAAALCTPTASAFASRPPSAAVLGSSTADLVSSATYLISPALASADSELMKSNHETDEVES
jgi:hypothetical protein